MPKPLAKTMRTMHPSQSDQWVCFPVPRDSIITLVSLSEFSKHELASVAILGRFMTFLVRNPKKDFLAMRMM